MSLQGSCITFVLVRGNYRPCKESGGWIFNKRYEHSFYKFNDLENWTLKDFSYEKLRSRGFRYQFSSRWFGYQKLFKAKLNILVYPLKILNLLLKGPPSFTEGRGLEDFW